VSLLFLLSQTRKRILLQLRISRPHYLGPRRSNASLDIWLCTEGPDGCLVVLVFLCSVRHKKVDTRIRLEPEDVQVYSSLWGIAFNLEALNLLVNGMYYSWI